MNEDQQGLHKATFPRYDAIHGAKIEDDISGIDPRLVAKMPLNSAALFNIHVNNEGRGTEYPFMIAKYEVPGIYRQVIRVVPQDARYIMEALIFEPMVLKNTFPKAEFTKLLNEKSVVLAFNIHSKVEGKHHPAIHAKKFIPWAYNACANLGVNYLLADLREWSDPYKIYMEELTHNGGNRLVAIEKTFPHPLYTQLGYKLYPKVHH